LAKMEDKIRSDKVLTKIKPKSKGNSDTDS
jgi:hypothetical protein